MRIVIKWGYIIKRKGDIIKVKFRGLVYFWAFNCMKGKCRDLDIAIRER